MVALLGFSKVEDSARARVHRCAGPCHRSKRPSCSLPMASPSCANSWRCLRPPVVGRGVPARRVRGPSGSVAGARDGRRRRGRHGRGRRHRPGAAGGVVALSRGPHGGHQRGRSTAQARRDAAAAHSSPRSARTSAPRSRSVAPSAHVWLFGHAADGNLHVNVTGVEPDDERIDDAVLRSRGRPRRQHLGRARHRHGQEALVAAQPQRRRARRDARHQARTRPRRGSSTPTSCSHDTRNARAFHHMSCGQTPGRRNPARGVVLSGSCRCRLAAAQSRNTTDFGALKCASRSRTHSMMSRSVRRRTTRVRLQARRMRAAPRPSARPGRR